MGAKRCAGVDRNRCVSCGACMKECPKGAIKVFCGCYAMVDETLCVGCGICAGICPADCITLWERSARS